jgi:hypothetical protein
LVILNFERDDQISRFVSVFHIAMGFDQLLQPVASVDDRSDLPRLDQVYEEGKILRTVICQPSV